MSEKRPIIISELKDDEIMEKAIHKAKANGWKVGIIHRYSVRRLYSKKQFFFHTFYNGIDVIILSHSFAKAFFQNDWEIRLQEMVLEPNPIAYLARYL